MIPIEEFGLPGKGEPLQSSQSAAVESASSRELLQLPQVCTELLLCDLQGRGRGGEIFSSANLDFF